MLLTRHSKLVKYCAQVLLLVKEDYAVLSVSYNLHSKDLMYLP
jgi:hypothetical protein